MQLQLAGHRLGVIDRVTLEHQSKRLSAPVIGLAAEPQAIGRLRRKSSFMDHLARTIVIIGLVLVGVGFFLQLFPSMPFLGKLPGDIRIERPGFTLYIPITTCLLVSAVLSGSLWILSRWR